jgi:hypothetical protein
VAAFLFIQISVVRYTGRDKHAPEHALGQSAVTTAHNARPASTTKAARMLTRSTDFFVVCVWVAEINAAMIPTYKHVCLRIITKNIETMQGVRKAEGHQRTSSVGTLKSRWGYD